MWYSPIYDALSAAGFKSLCQVRKELADREASVEERDQRDCGGNRGAFIPDCSAGIRRNARHAREPAPDSA